ncbi:hypothetical protein Asera_29460 [Actinocatenispora sera]|uniref:Uncharacterized protein n=1 Tax=Actinocatenispora sera TaxID=390989 RepID=A0A810L3W9_9ACTN|nr:hypothetical protein Asera_29460 [Actinocatenispora sera]
MLAQLGQQRGDLGRLVHPDAEYQRAPGRCRLVERVVDDHSADLVDRLGVTGDELEQGGAEILQDPAQAGPRSSGGHGDKHVPDGRARDRDRVWASMTKS